MKKISQKELSDILESGAESINTEFKTGFCWNNERDQYHKERTIKAILALSNTNKGGYVVVGVDEGKDELKFSGIKVSEWVSPKQLEKIRSDIEGFSYTTINFEMILGEINISEKEKRDLIIFGVREFTKTPVICKKNSQQGVLKKYDIYSRTIREGKVASDRVTHDELEEIIEMATDKDSERFMARLEGLLGQSAVAKKLIQTKKSDKKDELDKYFADEIKDMGV